MSDGWGVSYAALRLHRFDLATGQHSADVRTRHQAVSAMIVDRDRLYAATASRLFELSPRDLSIIRQWDRGLVRYTHRLLLAGSTLVAANWLTPTIGLFDRHSGSTQRVKVGRQPLVFLDRDVIKVIAGFDGSMWTLDTVRRRLVDVETIPPVARVAAGREIWGVLAGAPEGGQGAPPVWTKPPTAHVVRLPEGRPVIRLGAACSTIVCDDQAGVLWCLEGSELEVVSQDTGEVVARHSASGDFLRVDLEAKALFTGESRGRDRQQSTLSCYELPAI